MPEEKFKRIIVLNLPESAGSDTAKIITISDKKLYHDANGNYFALGRVKTSAQWEEIGRAADLRKMMRLGEWENFMRNKIKIMALVCLAILILISVLYYYFFVYGFSISTDTFVNINVEFEEKNVLITADTINSGYAFAGYDAVLTEGELSITPRYSMASNFHRSGKLEITYDTDGRLFDKIFLVGISEEDKREIWSSEVTE